LWDEAKYGLDGARLAAALADLDLLRFAPLVYDLDVWPPLFPLTESMVFLVAGNGFAVARGLVAVLFAGLVVVTWWAAREIVPKSAAVAAIAPALVVTSPFVQLFAVQAMLELPGALLYVLCLGAYAHHLRTGTRATVVATGVLSAALFFTKYNYGLLWLAPLLLNEAWVACDGPRGVFDRAISRTRRIDLGRPFTLFVAIYLVALAVIGLTGGGTLRLGERAVSITSIGNPLLLLVVIVLARAVWPPRRAWERWRRWERSLAERHRVLMWTIAIPVVVWLLLPPHLRSFVDFVENRSSGPPLFTAAGLLFYPRVFLEQYHARSVIGILVMGSAVVALARIGGAAPAARTLLLAVVVALAALTLHPYKEPRFLLIAAPALWLAAAWNVVTAVERGAAHTRRERPVWANAAIWTNGVLAVATLICVLLAPPTAPSLAARFAQYTVPSTYRPLLDRVAELAEAKPTLVLGTWNQMSPPLIEWSWLQRRRGAFASTPPDVVAPSRRAPAEQLLRRLRGPSPPDQIVLLDLDDATAPSAEWAAAFAAETAWLEPLRRDLDAGATPYDEVLAESLTHGGYRVRVFRVDGRSIPASNRGG
ncbi:MAG TPA: hypothetical protein VHR17_12370, partial [Thermoanaerobaculia bacterium]|nr:hypothetical protein [Thermoanaerobaculia bacterium]